VKLVMDFLARAGLRGTMDDDRRDLVIRLCTEAGIIMEDMSPIALTIGVRAGPFYQHLAQLETAVVEMAALLATARALISA
jgi:hypothetical protein